MTDRSGLPADDAPHILIVDDDKRIRDLLSRYLADNGFRVSAARDAAQASKAMAGLAFDVIVLDVMMPGQSGFEFAEEIRRTSQVPIVMLTALSESEERIRGLELGVNDYLGKPFEPRELVLRINNILVSATASDAAAHKASGEVTIGDFVFDIARGVLSRNGKIIRITERERDMLRLFASQPGTPVAREALASDDGATTSRAVDVQINRLRRKIEADPSHPVYLQTVRGKGYVLQTD